MSEKTIGTVSENGITVRTNFSVKDPASALTHFIGLVASVTAAPFLLLHVHEAGADALTKLGYLLFAAGLILLYGASTAYHTFRLRAEKAHVLKKYDHMMIFVLIAGSYSPLCLYTLRGPLGYSLFSVIWGLALFGMLFKFCWVTCPRWISSVLYLGMGWVCIAALPELSRLLSSRAFLNLILGGAAYSVGGILYAIRFRRFNERHPDFGTHEIFHLFVMLGSLFHFLMMYELL